jgi:hypothetical protein
MSMTKRSFYIRVKCNRLFGEDSMSEQVRYYKGKYKVVVLSESQGEWLVKALEPFEDELYGKNVKVKVGETRIVPPNQLFKMRGIYPHVQEHAYELKMEKKLKKMVEKEEEKETEESS